jgi:hypothetical protein
MQTYNTNDLASTDAVNNYQTLLNIINEAAETTIPHSTPRAVDAFKHRYWWDQDCKSQIVLQKQVYNTYQENSTIDNYIEYKRALAQTRKLFKNKRKASFREFCGSLNKNTNLTEVWNKIKILKNANGTSNKQKAKSNDWVGQFMCNIVPDSCQEMIAPLSNEINADNFLSSKFTIEELLYALNHRHDSSPGSDNIYYSMLSNLCMDAKNLLLNIYNDVYLNNIYIEEWSTFVVCPILKKNKDASDAKSYRPIALSSTITKTYERLIKNRLDWWLEHNKLLPKFQHGYRKGQSSLENLTRLTTDIQLSYSNNMFLTCFL